MSFFSQFPKIQYDINLDGIKTDVIDIFRHIDVREELIDDISTYTWYEIKNGERPDIVSTRLYGTPDYYWTFFVLNDTLKQGLNSWPKSHRQFQNMLEQDFEKYSILVFIPEQNPVARKYENNFEMSNYFGGLDLSNSNVRIKARDKNAEANILKFDDQRFQLWIHDIDKVSVFESNRYWYLDYIDNPYSNKTESENYLKFEAEKLEWAKYALEWMRLNYTSVYYEFLRDTENKQNITINSNAYYDYFLDTYFTKIKFKSHNFYKESYNAPSYFLDFEYDDERDSAFDAYSKIISKEDIDLIDDFTRGEVDSFVPQTREDGFDQSELAEYLEISAQRKYVPSFAKIYLSTQAKFVSYKEDLDEQTFEARKIRVIRPEHIDEFVELYQDKLNA